MTGPARFLSARGLDQAPAPRGFNWCQPKRGRVDLHADDDDRLVGQVIFMQNEGWRVIDREFNELGSGLSKAAAMRLLGRAAAR